MSNKVRLNKVLVYFEKTDDPCIVRLKVSQSTDDVYIIYDSNVKRFMTRGLELQIDTVELIIRDLDLEEIEVPPKTGAYTADELYWAGDARCQCGAGLAYPNEGLHEPSAENGWNGGEGTVFKSVSRWTCSALLMGKFDLNDPKVREEHMGKHDVYPFSFYSIHGPLRCDGRTTKGGTSRDAFLSGVCRLAGKKYGSLKGTVVDYSYKDGEVNVYTNTSVFNLTEDEIKEVLKNCPGNNPDDKFIDWKEYDKDFSTITYVGGEIK